MAKTARLHEINKNLFVLEYNYTASGHMNPTQRLFAMTCPDAASERLKGAKLKGYRVRDLRKNKI